MAQIAYGGIAGFLGGTSFTDSYYLTPEGYLATADGTVVSSSVFSQDIVQLHRTADLPIIPDDWTSWAPNPLNNEWDEYTIGTAPSVGSASMVDGDGIDLPSINPIELVQDDYDHDTVHYAFDPTAAAWQDLAYGETLTVTFVVSARERNAFGTFNESDTFTVTLNFTKVCFVRGTMIETIDGPVAIEDIRPGTLVRTMDSGFRPVKWIGSAVVGGHDKPIPANLRPIRIRAGALGANTPETDLLVSPQHRILVRSRIAQRMFSTTEVLVAAKQLLQVEGIDIETGTERVEYFHMMFDQHEIVFSNGAPTESLYLGAEALKGLGAAAVDEILQILPQLRGVLEGQDAVQPVRLMPSGRAGRKLAVRHISNGKALVN
ncbi:Hint domain-containing protein [Paracoccus kondratievae]|uniref:Hint domain-containing protein n=1 Tax=Paracoccus kondratievae TaxID=135740 RepID=UPI001D0D26D2|nr:Hint domain-containing protein [Paracoccus kondratievae]